MGLKPTLGKTGPVGIFDSGVGGLTVMAAVRRLLPDESLVYLGDTARVPYGTKSAETILRYTEECLGFLAGRGVKAIVIACNSASAHALPYLERKFHLPLLGVITAGVEEALKETRNGHIGVIGTQATITSNIYAREIKARSPKARITSMTCPLFVPLVEEGWTDHPVTRAVVREYLSAMGSDGIDTLILGCTHYPLLKNLIAQELGAEVRLIDSAQAVAEKLRELLVPPTLTLPRKGEGNLMPPSPLAEGGGNLMPPPSPLAGEGRGGGSQIYVTDLPDRFETIAKRFLGEPLPPVKRVTL